MRKTEGSLDYVTELPASVLALGLSPVEMALLVYLAQKAEGGEFSQATADTAEALRVSTFSVVLARQRLARGPALICYTLDEGGVCRYRLNSINEKSTVTIPDVLGVIALDVNSLALLVQAIGHENDRFTPTFERLYKAAGLTKAQAEQARDILSRKYRLIRVMSTRGFFPREVVKPDTSKIMRMNGLYFPGQRPVAVA